MNRTKAKTHLQSLINRFGYWSDEVRDFNGTLSYSVMAWANNQVERFPKYINPKVMRKYETNLNDAEYVVFLEGCTDTYKETIQERGRIIHEKDQEIQALKDKLRGMQDTHMPVDNIKAIIEHREANTSEQKRTIAESKRWTYHRHISKDVWKVGSDEQGPIAEFFSEEAALKACKAVNATH